MRYLSTIFFLLIFFGIHSCSQQSPDSSVEVISHVFEELIESDLFIIKRAVPPYKPFHPDSIDSEMLFAGRVEIIIDPLDTFSLEDGHESEKMDKSRLLKEYEEFDWTKYKRDYNDYIESLELSEADSGLIVILADSLFDFPEKYLSQMNNSLGVRKRLSEGSHLDSTWFSFFKNDLKNEPSFLDLSKIDIKINLKYDSERENIDGESINALMSFSKVVFNQAHNRGCFYYSLSCGKLCGMSNLVFVEKTDGFWTIIQIETISIS